MSDVDPLVLDVAPSPVGRLWLVCEGERLRALAFEDRDWTPERGEAADAGPPAFLRRRFGETLPARGLAPEPVRAALTAYFDGELSALDTLAVAAEGSVFQQAVWAQLRAIPAGSTVSYGEIARRVGQKDASRAVGLANGSNPVAVVVPCHRVIGASGALTGYGGGLARKRWLLGHEAAHAGLFAARDAQP